MTVPLFLLYTTILFVLGSGGSVPAPAPTAVPDSVFAEVRKRTQALRYEQGTMEMRMFDARGRQRVRSMQSWSFTEGPVSQTLIRFVEPADVRGTALLTLEDGTGTVQRLYLPAVGRIQTIGQAQQKDRFMGSDFLYEDLNAQDPDEFLLERLADEDGLYAVKAVPRQEKSYHYAVFLIDTSRFLVTKVRYFDAGGTQQRELVISEPKEVKPGIWRGDVLEMRDLRSSRRTVLTWKNRNVTDPIPGRIFTEREMMRQ